MSGEVVQLAVAWKTWGCASATLMTWIKLKQWVAGGYNYNATRGVKCSLVEDWQTWSWPPQQAGWSQSHVEMVRKLTLHPQRWCHDHEGNRHYSKCCIRPHAEGRITMVNDCFTHVGCDPLTLNIPHKEYVCRQFIVEAALHVVLLAVNMHSFFQ